MAPPNISSAAVTASNPSPPPPLPDKPAASRPGTAKSTRTLSNTSIPTLSTTRIVRQPSTSSSNATPPSRRPVRSGAFPPSSRSALPIPTLDPSQDHHRSDSGRSTGSSRSTATTDSFFIPQHPHVLNRRLKDLPAPPSSSALADATTHAKAIDAPPSALGLNVSIHPSNASNSLPASCLFRSKSSVSTTPTSPEEGAGSPLEPPAPDEFRPLDDENPKHQTSAKQDLDDFWKSDYSYARPSTDLLEPSLPPLMRSNAPIPPSRSQSLDPFAAPLDEHKGTAKGEDFPQNTLSSTEEGQLTSSATPLVAANLRKLNSQHLHNDTKPASTARPSVSGSSPVLSPASTTQTPTKGSDGSRLAVPRVSPYQQPAASASSSSSAIDHKPHLNKSSSSLSTSSAHEGGDKGALATASKRSSASSSSSFRMTLSRQAKTLRNSFMWTPPSTAQPASKSQECITASPALLSPESLSAPLSQDSSPGLSVSSPYSVSSELPSSRISPQTDGKRPVDNVESRQPTSHSPANASGNASAQKSKPPSLRSSHSSAGARSMHSGASGRPDAKLDSSISNPHIQHSPKQPTDYSKLEERPKSRLSSRLMMQNTHWSMKISSLKTKKANEATASKSVTSQTTVEAGPGAAGRRSNSNASSSTTGTVSSAAPLPGKASDGVKSSSTVRSSKRPGSLIIPPASLLTSDKASADAQISPSFAETFAFLNSHIDSPDQSPPLLAIVLPPLKDVKIVSASAKPSLAAPSSSPHEQRAIQTVLAPSANAQRVAMSTPSGQAAKTQKHDQEDKTPKETLFDRLADSPEAVYKTLVLPDPEPEPLPLPASQSLDSVVPNSSRFAKRFGHKKQTSLGSATLISKSARKAAADLDKRASGAPLAPSAMPSAHGRTSTRSSFSSVLPVFTPVDEESRFFDALTSPLSEQPPTASASPSADDSVLPTFATATDFFHHAHTEPTSPLLDRTFAPQSTTSVAAALPSATQPTRSSLGRRLSGVFDPSKARSVRKNLLASPPQSPRADSARLDALPARPETSLGFHLRNPLRRDRKLSLTKAAAVPQEASAPGRIESAASSRTMSPASAIRKMSSGFRLDRVAPATTRPARPDTSLGFATVQTKTSRAFSSSVLAPTKSSLARSVQPSPPSAGGKPAVRSSSASSLGTPPSNRQSRSPQRPLNPPSSFRGAPAASSRPSVFSNGSPSKSATARLTTSQTKTKTGSTNSRASQSLADGSRSSALALDSLLAESNPTTATQSSQGTDLAAASTASSEVRRRRTLSKPVLRPIRTSFAEEIALARPSTAMGFRGGLTVQDRKMSQPTLDMVDDREFLEALEQVRAVHRERIQAQAQEVENKTRLARLGMMSGNYLKTKVSGSMLDDNDLADSKVGGTSGNVGKGSPAKHQGASAAVGWSDASKALVKAGSRLRHKRSASADAKLGRSRSTSSTSRGSEGDVDQRQKDIVRAYADKKPPVGPPATGLGWGVGKASGKLHDGTFVNDDDWKKEVKALFLIRELVQTERSYARHLGSLLSVVRKMQVAPNGSTNALGIKRKSTSNLFAAYSSGKTSTSATPPSHVTLLRTYLPQLIALSNALVQRVEDNPTSAGVGAAFDVLAAQLESTFVGWSSVASQALKNLRSTELAKGKSPYKIGLVPLTPRESTEVGASTTDGSSSSGASSPGSGFRHSTLRMTSLTRPASPVGARHDADVVASNDASGATLPVKRSTKRRSTITSTSFIPPRVVVAGPAPLMTASPEEEKSPEAIRADAASSRRFAHSRSQSTLVTPLPTPTSSIGPEPWSALSMTSTATPASSQATQPTGAAAKCLTPMDIAIMPTQRIPRYGLMLRDLLRNTPPESLSHARVQRAISLIQKIALMCDSAAPIPAAPASGAATPSRASSVLGTTGGESLSVQASPLLTSSAFSLTKRN
ncbi:uncharacterized protein UTRI_03668_B [Ustilago trichophora]|uniref:DH domain-containing protein n=1 Tax=Ustilago trichophora TaxID=86804 RepID=A0A5C3DZC7_9BASI|nr:uncharacterized protein UTRI_03668_B [Ustilago trichophora]